jgi:hypothetical protein
MDDQVHVLDDSIYGKAIVYTKAKVRRGPAIVATFDSFYDALAAARLGDYVECESPNGATAVFRMDEPPNRLGRELHRVH